MSAYAGWGQREDEEEEVWQLARLLKTRAWLVGGRDDAAIDAVYRHRGALREVLAAVGCGLVVEPDLVRVYNPAPPLSARLPKGDWAQGVWFWLAPRCAGVAACPGPAGAGDRGGAGGRGRDRAAGDAVACGAFGVRRRAAAAV